MRPLGPRHTLLTDNLAAYSCGKCLGTLVSLVAYRAWRESARAATRCRATPTADRRHRCRPIPSARRNARSAAR